MVNRLLRERDARLATRSSSSDKAGRCRGEVAVVAAAVESYSDERVRSSRRDHASGGGVDDFSHKGCLSARSELDIGGGGGIGGGRSPDSAKGDLFFASDLVHPAGGSNDNAAVDPRVVGGPAAEGTLLLRLHDGQALAGHHGNMGMSSHSLHANEINSNRCGSEHGGAALMRSLPRPPLPPPGKSQQGSLFDHDALDGGLALSPQRGSPGRGAPAKRKGRVKLHSARLEVMFALAPW